MNFKTNSKASAIKELTDIHVALINTLILIEETDSTYAYLKELDSEFDSMCPKKLEFEAFVAAQESVLAEYSNLSTKLNSYESQYSQEAQKSHLQYLRPNLTKMNESIGNEKEVLQTMEYFC